MKPKPKKLGGAKFLAQGTLYPNVIESVSFTGGPSVTIKSHHNGGGLPERMNMRLIEPPRELFKDEVRALGRELGLPEVFVGPHPRSVIVHHQCGVPSAAPVCLFRFVTTTAVRGAPLLRESNYSPSA